MIVVNLHTIPGLDSSLCIHVMGMATAFHEVDGVDKGYTSRPKKGKVFSHGATTEYK